MVVVTTGSAVAAWASSQLCNIVVASIIHERFHTVAYATLQCHADAKIKALKP